MKHTCSIAISVQDLNPSNGGIERVTYTLSKELVRRGHRLYAVSINELPADSSLFAHYEGVVRADVSTPAGIVETVRFINDADADVFLNQFARSYTTVSLQAAVKDGTSAVLVDALHTNPAALDALKSFSRKLPIPDNLARLLFSIHKAACLSPRYRMGNRQSYALCDAFVVLSPSYIADFARRNRLYDTRKLHAITNPYDKGDNSNYHRDEKNFPRENIFLVVARLNNHEKRIDRVLRFWKSFHTGGDGWRLLIVGDGPDKEMLEAMAKDLGLADCSFEGHSDVPTDYYQRARIFLMTSDVEGFGMTLVEAMSAGCVPVAMNSFSALHDIISDKLNGMIVAKDDIDGMATAAKYIATHFDQMSACARQSAKQFDVEVVADKWEGLFEKLLYEQP